MLMKKAATATTAMLMVAVLPALQSALAEEMPDLMQSSLLLPLMVKRWTSVKSSR